MPDISELAARDNMIAQRFGQAYMPPPVLVKVIESNVHRSNGWVWADMEGSRIRLIVSALYDLSGASPSAGYLFWAIPLNGFKDSPEYLAIQSAWNGQDNSRIPRITVQSITNSSGVPIAGVTSVAFTASPSGIFDVAGSPITGSGTIALSMDNQSANTVLAGATSGGAATPAFRTLVALDIPDISASYLAAAFFAAKGDLISASANDTPALLTVGTNGKVLIADSAQTAGLKWGYRRMTLFDDYADATGGGTEADIYSHTLVASQLAANGDKIVASFSGNFVTLGTELTQLEVYFDGQVIWDSTGVAPATGTTSWRVTVEIIRVSATVIRYSVSLNTTGASGFVYCTVSELTGRTLSNTNVLKITGTSSGVGSGSGDIVGKMAMIEFVPAA